MEILIIAGLFWLYPALCFYLIAKKTRTQLAWMAWVPLFSGLTVCKLANVSLWTFFLLLVPLLGPLCFLLFVLPRIPLKLGITDGSRFFMAVPLLNYFYLGYLAFFRDAPESMDVSLP